MMRPGCQARGTLHAWIYCTTNFIREAARIHSIKLIKLKWKLEGLVSL